MSEGKAPTPSQYRARSKSIWISLNFWLVPGSNCVAALYVPMTSMGSFRRPRLKDELGEMMNVWQKALTYYLIL